MNYYSKTREGGDLSVCYRWSPKGEAKIVKKRSRNISMFTYNVKKLSITNENQKRTTE